MTGPTQPLDAMTAPLPLNDPVENGRLIVVPNPTYYLKHIESDDWVDELLIEGWRRARLAVAEGRDGNEWVVYREIIANDLTRAWQEVSSVRRRITQAFPGDDWSAQRADLMYVVKEPLDESVHQFPSVESCAIFEEATAELQDYLSRTERHILQVANDVRMSKFWLAVLYLARRDEMDWWQLEDFDEENAQEDPVKKLQADLDHQPSKFQYLHAAHRVLKRDGDLPSWKALHVAVSIEHFKSAEHEGTVKKRIDEFRKDAEKATGKKVKDRQHLKAALRLVLFPDLREVEGRE